MADAHDMSVFPEYIRDAYGNWWACEHPERPWDEYALFDEDDCPACALALRAVAANGLGHIELVNAETLQKNTVAQIIAGLDR